MKKFGLASLVLLALNGCNFIRPSFVDERSYEVHYREDNAQIDGVDGPTGGHFDDEGRWIPDNPNIALTYKLPDIGVGFLFDIKTRELVPNLHIELLEVDTHVPLVNTLKLDLGIAYQRTYLYVGKLWTNIFEISTGGFFGYNWQEKDWSYGVGCTILRF